MAEMNKKPIDANREAVRYGEAEAARRGMIDKPRRGKKRLLKRDASNTTLGQASALGD